LRSIAIADTDIRRAARFAGGNKRIGLGAETTYFDSAFDLGQLILPEFSFVQVNDTQRFHSKYFYSGERVCFSFLD